MHICSFITFSQLVKYQKLDHKSLLPQSNNSTLPPFSLHTPIRLFNRSSNIPFVSPLCRPLIAMIALVCPCLHCKAHVTATSLAISRRTASCSSAFCAEGHSDKSTIHIQSLPARQSGRESAPIVKYSSFRPYGLSQLSWRVYNVPRVCAALSRKCCERCEISRRDSPSHQQTFRIQRPGLPQRGHSL